MASNENDEHEVGANPKGNRGCEPRDTDHPTGAEQAAENAENDPRAESDAELQRLAQRMLLVIEPILQAASALGVGAEGAEPGNCQNNWCPLCAAVAMSRGEQHPVVDTLVAAGATMIAAIRAAAQSEADDSTNDGGLASDPPSPPASSGYQHIPVNLVD